MYRLFIALFVICIPTYGNKIRLFSPKLDGRIVGGEDADIEELPYQLSLQEYNHHVCGASIISDTWVLTASHCVYWSYPENLNIRAGSSIREQGGSLHQVTKIITHPKYNDSTTDYDYALIKIDTPFPLGQPSVQTIKLADYLVETGSVAITSGWGTTTSGVSNLPNRLQQVKVSIIDQQICNDSYGRITSRMICAGKPEGGKDSCQGDSGGPLVVDGILVGIVSWGNGCGDADYPGVYANIVEQREWIRLISGV